MKLQEAYKMVYEDMLQSECGLLVGNYDAVNGGKQFMYGISTVMEWIAYRVSEEEYNAFSDVFIKNMLDSERKALTKRRRRDNIKE
jgi:hypothetical protein